MKRLYQIVLVLKASEGDFPAMEQDQTADWKKQTVVLIYCLRGFRSDPA